MFNPQIFYEFGKSRFTGLLDLYPNAAQAFSFRLLRKGYTGACIRVKRDSDNAELDIYFTNNYLDTISLISFCGSANLRIKTFYDQSGNNRDLTSQNSFNICTAGTVTTYSGKIAGSILNGSSTNTGFTPFNLNAHSLFHVGKIFTPTYAGYGGIYCNIPLTGNGVMYPSEDASGWRGSIVPFLNNSERASNTRASRSTAKTTPTSLYLNNWNYDGNITKTEYENGTLQTLTTSASGWGTGNIGNLGGYNGYHQIQDFLELIVYPVDQTSVSSNINNNIKTFYNL